MKKLNQDTNIKWVNSKTDSKIYTRRLNPSLIFKFFDYFGVEIIEFFNMNDN